MWSLREKNLCAISIRMTFVPNRHTLFLCGDTDHMADAGDRLPLEAGGGGQQGPGGREQNALPSAPVHLRQQVAVEH